MFEAKKRGAPVFGNQCAMAQRSSPARSAREIELQALATLAALAQISTPSAAHFLKSHQLLYQIPLIRTRGPIGAVRWT
jgi:hypothetical protein